jgi:5-methylcytosine-specific restriction endonuclease McrA
MAKISPIGICEVCGCKVKILIHHKNRNHKDNSKENLQELCRSCHSKEHILEGTAGKHEQSFSLTDYFKPQSYGYRLTRGFAMLRDDE